MDLPEVASAFVDLHLFPLQLDLTANFEETVTFERALYHFVRTVMRNVPLNLASLDLASTLVSAFHYVLRALCGNVFLHIAKGQAKTALKQTLYYAIGALFD